MFDVVAPFVGFWEPLQKGLPLLLILHLTIVLFSGNLKLPFLHELFQVRVLYTCVVALLCNKNFPCFIAATNAWQDIFHSTHERIESCCALCILQHPNWFRSFNVHDVCLSFRNRSCCNGIRTGVEEDSSDGSLVGGSCWGYRSTGPGARFNAWAIRCSTGVASLVFGGTSGRQRRCILRLLRLIISRVFLPRDLIDSWDT